MKLNDNANDRTVRASRHEHVCAFTLIELLLSVCIFAIVLAAINTVFYSALKLRNSTVRTLDESAPIQSALSTIRRDLQGALPPNTNGFVGDFRNNTTTSTSTSEPGAIEFFTSSASISDDAPWGDVQKVIYELRNSTTRTTTRGKDLIRSVTRNLLPTSTEQREEQWLMGNVELLEFSCFDGATWRDSWDTSSSSTTTNLPQAVLVRIQLASENNVIRKPQEMMVLLASQWRTNSGAAQ